MNPQINFYIRIFGHDDTDMLEGILRTLGAAARSAEKRISDVAKTHDSEDLAEVFTEENMLIEGLLGCAFVAAQTYIELVVARTERLRQRVKNQCHHDLKTTKCEKHEIIHKFSDLVTGSTYSKIELINACANYFKHHERWPSKWDCATRKDIKNTIRIIRAVGASENSSDNCRKGLVALGIDPVFNVFMLAEILHEWHAKLTIAYKQELRSLDQLCKASGDTINRKPGA
ncbi:MAG: hypothetical protein ACREFE_04660 [Limisphaerales bacterium]